MDRVIRKSIKRIKETAAFTLAEALVAMIIMLLVSGMLVAGIPAAFNAYDNVFLASNAEVVLSTTIISLRNELGTAKDVEVTDDTTINYYNEAFASESQISLGDVTIKEGENGAPDQKAQTILYNRYAQDSELGNMQGSAERFISESTTGKNLVVTYDSVAKSNDGKFITFTNLKVNKIKNDGVSPTLAVRPTYSVRLFAADAVSDNEDT